MKRFNALSVVCIVYGIAIIMGVAIFRVLPWDSLLFKIILVDIMVTIFIWLMSVVFKNSSIYDPYWSVAPMIILPLFVVNWDFSAFLLLILVFYWGIRLTLNWAYTFKGLDHQDWRYSYYKNKFPRVWQLVNLFGIHLFPTIIVIGVMIPGYHYLQASESANLLTIIAAMIGIVSVSIQLISDIQMHIFRKNNPGCVNSEGLWKHSRHPNYFGEIMFWWSVWLMAVSVSPSAIFLAFGPLANTLMFLFISIPLMENRQTLSKPEYVLYQQTTRMLIPLARKEEKAKESS